MGLLDLATIRELRGSRFRRAADGYAQYLINLAHHRVTLRLPDRLHRQSSGHRASALLRQAGLLIRNQVLASVRMKNNQTKINPALVRASGRRRPQRTSPSTSWTRLSPGGILDLIVEYEARPRA